MQLTILAAALNTQIPATAGPITSTKHDYSYPGGDSQRKLTGGQALEKK